MDAGVAFGFPALLAVKLRMFRARDELADTDTVLKYSAFYAGQWLCSATRCCVRRRVSLRFLQQVARGCAFLCADYKEEGILLYWFCCQHFFEDVALAILQVGIGPHHQGDYLHLGLGTPWLIAYMKWYERGLRRSDASCVCAFVFVVVCARVLLPVCMHAWVHVHVLVCMHASVRVCA